MHPEIRQPGPGRCPKCGMELVEEKSALRIHHADSAQKPVTWKSYLPLAVIFLLLTATALILTSGVREFVLSFMAGFFIIFGGFKLFDLSGFAQGYSTYDLLAGRWYGYGYVYPFIELAFGFTMLAGFHPDWLLWTEFVVMVFSGLGVVRKLAKGEEVQCVCLGTVLKVPLTFVTLIEDFGMAALVLLLLFVI